MATIPGRPRRLMWVGWTVTACLLTGLITSKLLVTTEQLVVQRLSVVLPSEAPVYVPLGGGGLALSPDGRHLVYAAATAKGRILHHRPLDQDVVRAIAGTEGASRPFFSADGVWIAFFADGKLKKIPTIGGVATVLADAGAPPYAGGSWNAEGVIVFSASWAGRGRLFKVSERGGTPELLTGFEAGNHVSPHFLPDGTSVLFSVVGETQLSGSRGAVVSLETGQLTIVLDEGRDPRYASTGHLLYLLSGTLMAAPFDADRLTVTGGPVALAEGFNNPNAIAMSRSGVFAHLTQAELTPRRSLVWVDRRGQSLPASKEVGAYAYPRISPDGRRVAVGIDFEMWVLDTVRGSKIALTSGDRIQANPTSPVSAWTADGSSITFSSFVKAGEFALELIRADGSGRRETLLKSRELVQPGSWSRDGKTLAFYRWPEKSAIQNDRDLWLLHMGSAIEEKQFLSTRFRERAPYLSPDNRSVVYVSDASGRDEIYVRPLDGDVGQTIVSNEGGTEPVWARDGKTIFYRNGRQMMSVSVGAKANSPIAVGDPQVVFEGNYVLDPSTTRAVPNYDVSPDGTRFLMVSGADTANSLERLSVVLNFFEELKQRASAR